VSVLIAVTGLAMTATGLPPDRFLRISDDEGLAHSDVRAIAQDHEGYIWLGLRLAGLTRYDGYELKVHQHDPEDPRTIGSRVIWSLLVDRTGTLWIGTEGGLDRYDRATGSFIHFRNDPARADSLPNNVVVSLLEDASGRIWAGTRDGLCRLDDRDRGSFTVYRRPQVIAGSLANDTYRSITEDKSTGLLWLGASDGLAAFDPRTGAFATFLHDPDDPQSLSNNAVNKVVIDPDRTFWALTENGLNTFTPTFDRIAEHGIQQPRQRFRRMLQPTSEGTRGINFVRDGVVDRVGRLWFATRGGVQLFDRATGKFHLYQRRAADASSLGDDLTQTIFKDRSGDIWVGTYAGGASLLRLEGKPFRIHRHDPNDPRTLSEDRVTGLAFDRQNRLWVSTGRGLNRRDADGWTRFLHDQTDPGSLPANDLTTVAVSPGGDIWLGSNYGVFRYDHSRFHSFPASPSNVPAPNGSYAFTGSQVHSLFPDAKGGVWLGARAYGLDYYLGGRFKHYNPQDAATGRAAQPTTNAVFGFESSDGKLWFATEASGLVRLDAETGEFTAFQPPNRASGVAHSLHCLAQGPDGMIWLGAAAGLFHFDPRTERFVRHYTVADGLPHPAVMSIVRDLRGRLWLATANGLARFDPATATFRVYEKPDGLPSDVFSQRCGALGPDGRVYFGTRAGVVDFSPDELRDNPIAPPVVLTEFRWLGPPPPGATESILQVPETVRVPAGQLGFAIQFSALDFSAPQKNRFRHRLEGWDDGWTETHARDRSATYTALPPGTYTFRVQASNPDLVWNEQGAAVRIVVEPHFWQTWWFRGFFLVGLTGLMIVAIQWRLRSVRQRNTQLEYQVSQRTAQLEREVAVRQQAEAGLRESHAELERRVQARTAELARSNASLQAEMVERKNVEAQLRQSQKMEAVGQLAGGVAHDFNNLLTVILGQSTLLTMPDMKAEDRLEAVRDIKAAAQRATNLTRQLLIFSRRQAMNPVPTDLNQVVMGVSKLIGRLLGEHITQETELCPGHLGVLADAGMIEQVVINFAVNARDAMRRGGRLRLVTARVNVSPEQAARTDGAKPGNMVRLSVSDTGSGIPEHVLPRIFEPFFTTKETGKGTGLGLAISLGIVQQHQGWIEVETQPGTGSTFHVFLPPHDLPAQTPATSPASTPGTGQNRTILLVEDEVAVRSVARRMLERQGYRVIEAGSASEALERWTTHHAEINILLTDIVMPGPLNGHELAARLLAEKPALRVVTMSGYDPREFAGGAGVPGPHLRKPFTNDDLLKAVDGA
jgi:ligand-binding sensor domain-containing protein/signal transduction histidine kinase